MLGGEILNLFKKSINGFLEKNNNVTNKKYSKNNKI